MILTKYRLKSPDLITFIIQTMKAHFRYNDFESIRAKSVVKKSCPECMFSH